MKRDKIMKYHANAKINLGLEIVGKKENYHLLDMVILPISLYDEIEITLNEEDQVIFNNAHLPQSNTVTQAINLMKQKYNIKKCFKVIIDKKIPIQAGLGGGSSDAATCILAINEILNLNRSLEELADISLEVGSDVPFFIYNKQARVKGMGEIIQPLITKLNSYILLVKPFKGVSTKECYGLYQYLPKDKYLIDELIDNISENKLNSDNLVNDLLIPATTILPCIKNIIKRIKYAGVDLVQMSGSGSTVFALSNDLFKLQQLEEKLKSKYPFVGIYEIIN